MQRIDPIVLKLYQRRLSLGLSQRDVAERSRMFTSSSVSLWELGETQPTLPCLRMWAQVLGHGLTLEDAEAAGSSESTTALETATKEVDGD